MTKLDPARRRLLQLAAASASSLWLPRSAWSQASLKSDPFTLGVASGSPTQDSVVLWTRLLSEQLGQRREPVTVRWEVAHDQQFSRIVQSGQAQALAELAHSVHVEVAGLAPDRWYFYRFMLGDAVSATGRTRTFPAPDAMVARMRLAYASCQNWQQGYYSAYRHMQGENLDAVLFLGDYIYEYPDSSNPVRPVSGGWVVTLDDYRQRYALHKSDPDLQAMHQACPWLLTWDDHEVQNDYAGLHEGRSGAAVPDFAARRAAAYQAYYEHMPLRAAVLTRAVAGLASGAEMRIYSRLHFGRLASFYLLDARQYKDPQACTRDGQRGSSTLDPAGCAAWTDPGRSMLGAQQERWLDAELGRAGRQWNVLGQQSLLGQRDFRPGPSRRLWNDGWDGYSAARTRLTDSQRKHAVNNAVVLGGDVHENWVGHIKADYGVAASPAVGVEFCGTSITSRSGGNEKTAERLAENPHFVFADAERKGYGVVELTPGRLTTSLRVVSDVRQPHATLQTLASFTVQAGRPVLEKE
ncbi:alkaline phosphatase D [Polaromonas sp. OV174]|uniref:alkaline phosphatase D family protein n=1 Tax=Polaromonas sp. OV174 TaxID=1855300 RepID=UPI0008F0D03E|nr:alkaline phosphatase D family protein [Polaromonas sp. OV174]SFB95222.1 alkaline phosphatase D [Polaromonas sp. OV174]